MNRANMQCIAALVDLSVNTISPLFGSILQAAVDAPTSKYKRSARAWLITMPKV
jgi:hypothetical protein